jgi:hypothetical protein
MAQEKLGYIAYKVDAKDDRKQQDQDLEAEQPYKLPDGQVITVGVERFRAPERELDVPSDASHGLIVRDARSALQSHSDRP